MFLLAKNKRLTSGLRKLFKKRKASEIPPTFVTMRLGTKWADKLNPGDKVAISISDDSAKPNIIGHARVRMVKKCVIFQMSSEDEDLQNNIGAKNWHQVVDDMQSVYGGAVVSLDSIITIIEFMVDR